MPARLALFLALVALAGCADPRSTEALLDAASEADIANRSREAAALYRDAAHRGDRDAALVLSGRGVDKRSLGDWLFDTRPTHREARWWEVRVRREAARQIAAGDAAGHLALARMAWFNGQSVTGDDADSLAFARRHFDTAVALGSREAVRDRAVLVWQTEGLLAAEPYFRQSARAGFVQGAELAALAISQRPRLERGLDARDVIGDLSARDDVGTIRFMQSAGFPELEVRAEGMIDAFESMAQSGDAAADSILRALDGPPPSAPS